MKERPILFSTPMVQAILEGRKSQTRRIVRKQPHGAGEWIKVLASWAFPSVNPYIKLKCPYGEPGDRLWVRETWAKTGENFHDDWPGHGDFYYRADDPFSELESNSPTKGIFRWRPSIFMPREACRIMLEVTDVRVEKLLDISERDAEAEGVEASSHDGGQTLLYKVNYLCLWDKINGKGSWDKNPWVWVIEFKKIQP